MKNWQTVEVMLIDVMSLSEGTSLQNISHYGVLKNVCAEKNNILRISWIGVECKIITVNTRVKTENCNQQ